MGGIFIVKDHYIKVFSMFTGQEICYIDFSRCGII